MLNDSLLPGPNSTPTSDAYQNTAHWNHSGSRLGQLSWDFSLEGGWGWAGPGTYQQCVQLCRVVGEEPGGLLAQLADLGNLPGKSKITVTWSLWWHLVSHWPLGDP